MSFNMYVPTRFIFGNGRLNDLNQQKLPGKKAILAISSGKSVRGNGTLDRTLEQLKTAGIEAAVFAGIGANPTKTAVMEGAKFARDNGCDFIVALGGGSVMDAAKAIAMMTTCGIMSAAKQEKGCPSRMIRFPSSALQQLLEPAVRPTSGAL